MTTPEQAAVDSGLSPADTPRVGGETPEQIAVDAAQEPRESASGNEVAGETGAPDANGKAPVANAPAGTQPRESP